MDKELIIEGLRIINALRKTEMFAEESMPLIAEYIRNSSITLQEYIYNVNASICLEKGYINISHLINPNKPKEGERVEIVWQKNKYEGRKEKEFNFDDSMRKLMENY